MVRVTRSMPPISRPAGRLLTLLVLAVLAGVLGMHGLALGVPTAHAGAGHERATGPTTGAPHAEGGAYADAGADRACGHTDGGPGHLDHADGTCAAAGTASAYTPPALTGAATDTPAVTVPSAAATGASRDGRAPPDLSELQLLRI
ncbi:hypothetical protein SROCM77S_04596 [Streptomyces rochei]|uniref:DUF6153 family protein n=1 Tax=Streptomyces sp. NRRL WC-3795 TaxID=1463938 RepID=UPI0004C8254E|nr:DUF6153 family protein [Streptomyces sp. NRRL WC-3795]